MIISRQSFTLCLMGESKLDCSKVGTLLFRLQKEKGLTQKQVADRMNLSDKTISERGLVKLYPEQEASVRLPKIDPLLHKYSTRFFTAAADMDYISYKNIKERERGVTPWIL